MTLKRVLRPVLALVLALSCLLCAACSTPRVAMTVGDKDYEMGDYLAYLYLTVYSNYYYQYYAQYQGLDSTGWNYGDSTQSITLSEYIQYATQDSIFYQRALELMMKEEGIEWDAEELATVEQQLKSASLTQDQFIDYGFTNDRYINAYKALSLNEMSLFNGRYNKGGTQEVPEEDIRTYFDENYLSYFIIEESLVDSSGNDLSDEKIDGFKSIMGKVVDAFNAYSDEEKTIENFQVLYRQYLTDKEELEEKLESDSDSSQTTTDSSTTGSTTTTAATTTTTVATTTTTTAATTTTATGTGTTTTTTGTSDTTDDTDDDAEEEKTLDRTDAVIENVDEELVKAIQGIEEGAIDLVTYKKSGTTETLAVIFRLDPEAQRGKDDDGNDVDYYEDSRDQTLQLLKYDAFTEEVEARVKVLRKSAVLNDRAFKSVEMEKLFGLDD